MQPNLILRLMEGLRFARADGAAGGQEPAPMLAIPTATDKPAELPFVQLRDGVRRCYEGLWALEVEYEQATEALADWEGGEYDRLVPRVTYCFAFKAEKRFKSQTPHRADQPDDRLRPELIMAFDGHVTRSYMPEREQASIDPHKSHFIDSDAYTQALAIPIQDEQRSLVLSTELFLPFALDRAEGEWKVRSRLELFDGAESCVLESKHNQRIWIDPKIGFAMRFREMYQELPDRPKDQWPLCWRYAFRQHQQVADHLWLPRRIEAVGYTSTRQPEDFWNRPSARTVHEVKKLAVNEQVPDSRFTLCFPAGTRVNDAVRGRYYRIGPSNQEIDLTGRPFWPGFPS